MITDFLENHIKVVESVDSWQESVEIAGEELLKKNYITSNYINSAIENINKNGSYIVIMPKVAIPHSRPEEGVKQTSLSLIKLNNSVLYPDEKEVKLVLMLAAVDHEKHLKLISSLTDLLGDQEKMKKIMNADTKEEILKIIK